MEGRIIKSNSFIDAVTLAQDGENIDLMCFHRVYIRFSAQIALWDGKLHLDIDKEKILFRFVEKDGRGKFLLTNREGALAIEEVVQQCFTRHQRWTEYLDDFPLSVRVYDNPEK